MSKEKLQAFAEAVSKSEELQKRFASIQMEAVRSTAEKMAKLSESAGTPFTAEEYLQSVRESSEELSAEQLQTVSGGLDKGQLVLWSVITLFFTAGAVCAIQAAASEVGQGRHC